MIIVVITIIKITTAMRKMTKTQRNAQYSCSPPTDHCPASLWAGLVLSLPAAMVYHTNQFICWSWHFMVVEYPFGSLRSPVLTVIPPIFLCSPSLAEHRHCTRSHLSFSFPLYNSKLHFQSALQLPKTPRICMKPVLNYLIKLCLHKSYPT